MKKLSFTLFQNTELLPLLLIYLLFLIVLFFLLRILPLPQIKEKPRRKPPLEYLKPSRREPIYTKRDYFYILAVTGFYALFSLWQLGSTTFPTTTWQPTKESQEIILELPEKTHFDAFYTIFGEGDNNSNESSYQIGFHDIQVSGSNDLNSWDEITTLGFENDIYQYKIISGDYDYKYIRFFIPDKNDTITEVGFKAFEENTLLPVQVYLDEQNNTRYPATLLIDEQDKIVFAPTYYDQAYFDEVYHPRNAWEIANGQLMYASVHPLLGTTLIAISIKLFGMHPFAWRLPGALVGIALVPLFYAILKRLFSKREMSLFGTVLFATEFMHYTTSRIATLEPFSVLFILLMFYYMIRYFFTHMYDCSFREQIRLLFLSGFFMSLGFATKWTVCYSAVGLAIIFFFHLYLEVKAYRQVKKDNPPQAEMQYYLQKFPNRFLRLGLWCVLFFIIFPIVIYFIAYIPTKIWRDGYSIQNVISYTQGIYSYHKNLNATHPYQSYWYQWILDLRPIWYHNSTDLEGYRHTISCFTNPITTWIGFICVPYTLASMIMDRSKTAFLLLVGYFTALLPWVFVVDRCVFAYHFYPTSIFMLMAIVYTCNDIRKKAPKFKWILWVVAICSVLSFFFFLPVISGFGTSSSYLQITQWFSSWYFGG